MSLVFDPDAIHEIGLRAAGLPHGEMCRMVIDQLVERYPRYVAPRLEWIFNRTAGATGVMCVLHASITEYVILFGTPVGTEGFSGRYLAEVYDCVLAGEMWTYTVDSLAGKIVHQPGELAALGRKEVKGFRLSDECWLLEYGRGAIPTMLPLALGDSIFSAMDVPTIARTLWVYGRQVTANLREGKL